MAVRKNQSLRTSVNISGGPARQSLTNGSSARKFTAKDIVQNNDASPIGLRSNAEHIIDAAAGIRTTGIVVAKVAEAGLAQLQAVRSALQSVSPTNPTTPTKNPSFDEHDLRVSQESLVQGVLGSLGQHPVPDVQSRIEGHAYDLVQGSVTNALPVSQKGNGVSTNTAAPDIDYVSVKLDVKKGILDMFCSSVVFSVPRSAVAAGKVKAIRIFRALVDNPDFFLREPARLSAVAVERLCSQPPRSRRKNQDYLGQYELQLSGMNVDNAITALNPIDPSRKLRVQSSDDQPTATDHLSANDRPTGDGVTQRDVGSFVQPDSFLNLDRSVARDLNSIKNIQLQNPQLAARTLPPVVPVGSSIIMGNAQRLGAEQIRQNRSRLSPGAGNTVVDSANRVDFKEIAFLSPGKLTGLIIGDSIQYSYDDPSINYAKSYRYYVVTVDDNMVESQRSRIVQINVDGIRIPQVPTRASAYVISRSVCLTAMVDDLLVEKFEIYRRELTGPTGPDSSRISIVAGTQGYHVSEDTRQRLPNGFLQIGEVANHSVIGGTFYDRDVKPGHKYVYRIFSVDVFGNKSESPREIQVFYPDPQKHVDLATPSILAEVDSTTGKVRVTIHCDDTRVTRLFLSRRDVSIGQSAFVPPGQIEHIRLGSTDSARGAARFDDVRYGMSVDRSLVWNGMIENTQDNIVFYDNSVMQDRTYQYQVYGTDRFGNSTQAATSGRLLVANRFLIFEPQNLTAQVSQSGSVVTGISLSWDDPNIDISPEDRIGNRETLRENQVRTLYQVSRRRVGEDSWVDFAMTENQTVFDPARLPSELSPLPPLPQRSSPTGYAEQQVARSLTSFQSASLVVPPKPLPQQAQFLVPNETYMYRVQTFQSGNFISNFSDPVVVTVILPVTTPVNFRVRPGDTKVRPFYVALNWDTSIDSGIVDRWEIERVAVNNIAAARFNNLNPSDFSNLTYVPYKVIYAESSRFRERTDDDLAQRGLLGGTGPTTLLTGQNHYLDQDVEFGNTYFYRIRAVSPTGGQTSGWAYRGVKVTDDSYEKKQNAILTADERSSLSTTIAPISSKVDFFSQKQTQSSLSIGPMVDDNMHVSYQLAQLDVGSSNSFYKKLNPKLTGGS